MIYPYSTRFCHQMVPKFNFLLFFFAIVFFFLNLFSRRLFYICYNNAANFLIHIDANIITIILIHTMGIIASRCNTDPFCGVIFDEKNDLFLFTFLTSFFHIFQNFGPNWSSNLIVMVRLN
jgi:hypothetical protein